MANSILQRRSVVVVVAVLVAVSVSGLFLFARYRIPGLSEEEARAMAAGFLAEIRAGRVDAAWSATAPDFKSMYGRDRFRTYVKSKPVLKTSTEFERCDFKVDGDLRLAECTFRPVGGKGIIKVVLSPDQRVWKVGRLAVE